MKNLNEILEVLRSTNKKNSLLIDTINEEVIRFQNTQIKINNKILETLIDIKKEIEKFKKDKPPKSQ